MGVARNAPIEAHIATEPSQLSFQSVLPAPEAHVKIAGAQSDTEKVCSDLHCLTLLYYGHIVPYWEQISNTCFRTQHVRKFLGKTLLVNFFTSNTYENF